MVRAYGWERAVMTKDTVKKSLKLNSEGTL
jgi:hypothetical protein